MAVPLLGLASILGREYANSQPTVEQRDNFLKVFSPHTYYGNQLIQYLTDKFDPAIGSGLKDAQVLSDQYAVQPYYEGRSENRLSEEEYDKQMQMLRDLTNSPTGQAKFENFMRDMDYGTQIPEQSALVGPLEEYSNQYMNDEYDFSNSISDYRTGVSDSTDTDMSQDRSNDMPQGGGKGEFDIQAEYEQYLRGGLIQRRR